MFSLGFFLPVLIIISSSLTVYMTVHNVTSSLISPTSLAHWTYYHYLCRRGPSYSWMMSVRKLSRSRGRFCWWWAEPSPVTSSNPSLSGCLPRHCLHVLLAALRCLLAIGNIRALTGRAGYSSQQVFISLLSKFYLSRVVGRCLSKGLSISTSGQYIKVHEVLNTIRVLENSLSWPPNLSTQPQTIIEQYRPMLRFDRSSQSYWLHLEARVENKSFISLLK